MSLYTAGTIAAETQAQLLGNSRKAADAARAASAKRSFDSWVNSLPNLSGAERNALANNFNSDGLQAAQGIYQKHFSPQVKQAAALAARTKAAARDKLVADKLARDRAIQQANQAREQSRLRDEAEAKKAQAIADQQNSIRQENLRIAQEEAAKKAAAAAAAQQAADDKAAADKAKRDADAAAQKAAEVQAKAQADRDAKSMADAAAAKKAAEVAAQQARDAQTRADQAAAKAKADAAAVAKAQADAAAEAKRAQAAADRPLSRP